MKVLVKGVTMTSEDLADWFGVKRESFLRTKKAKLEELADFCDYEILTTSSGYFKAVCISEVYTPTYYRNTLKKEFLAWIESGGIEEVAAQTPDNVYSYPTVVNYYCANHGITYQGPHYYNLIEDGTGDSGYKVKNGSRRVDNKDFLEWHYLYRLLKKYQMNNKIKCGPWVDCCAESFNPTFLRKETEDDRELQNQVYQKYFGKISYQDVCELMDDISDMVDRGEITERDKDKLIDNKIMRSLTNKEKRLRAAEECVGKGILRRKGKEYGQERQGDNVFFEMKEGDFDF